MARIMLAPGLVASCALVLAACSPTGVSTHPKGLVRNKTTTSVVALPASPPSTPSDESLSTAGLLPAWPQLHDRLVLKTSAAVAGKTSDLWHPGRGQQRR